MQYVVPVANFMERRPQRIELISLSVPDSETPDRIILRRYDLLAELPHEHVLFAHDIPGIREFFRCLKKQFTKKFYRQICTELRAYRRKMFHGSI